MSMEHYKKISSAEAKNLMDSMNAEDYILLDVRSQPEFEAGYIKGAVLIPVDELEVKMSSMFPDKDKTIFVYCRSGVRSKSAATALAEAGYQNVYDFGGIIDWKYDTVVDY